MGVCVVDAMRHAPAALLLGRRPITLCPRGLVVSRVSVDRYGESRPIQHLNRRPSSL